jgi:hypothetical protein
MSNHGKPKNYGGMGKLLEPVLRGFSPINKMLRQRDTTLTILTVDSLYGFMLKMTPEKTMYTDFNDAPIQSFILKIVIIDKNEGVLSNYAKEEEGKSIQVRKHSLTKQMFIDESSAQQRIWVETMSGGSPPLSPSVCNFAIFNNINTSKFLEFLTGKYSTSKPVGQLIRYLSDLNTPIGILTLPYIPNSKTLSMVKGTGKNGISKIPTEVKVNILSQIFRLAELGFIHTDLHSGNILVEVPEQGTKYTYMSMIIDFGRYYKVSVQGEGFVWRHDIADDDKDKDPEAQRIYVKKKEYELLNNYLYAYSDGSKKLKHIFKTLGSKELYNEIFDRVAELARTNKKQIQLLVENNEIVNWASIYRGDVRDTELTGDGDDYEFKREESTQSGERNPKDMTNYSAAKPPRSISKKPLFTQSGLTPKAIDDLYIISHPNSIDDNEVISIPPIHNYHPRTPNLSGISKNDSIVPMQNNGMPQRMKSRLTASADYDNLTYTNNRVVPPVPALSGDFIPNNSVVPMQNNGMPQRMKSRLTSKKTKSRLTSKKTKSRLKSRLAASADFGHNFTYTTTDGSPPSRRR